TRCPTSWRCTWPGTNCVKLLAIAMIGFSKSASCIPVARQRARAPATFLPWVEVRLRYPLTGRRLLYLAAGVQALRRRAFGRRAAPGSRNPPSRRPRAAAHRESRAHARGGRERRTPGRRGGTDVALAGGTWLRKREDLRALGLSSPRSRLRARSSRAEPDAPPPRATSPRAASRARST